MTLDTHGAELHLGILQNRLAKIRGEQNICANKILMKEHESKDPNAKQTLDIDIETEKLNEKALEKKYAKAEKELIAYEDAVLKLTTL